jgi:hypothetical protein
MEQPTLRQSVPKTAPKPAEPESTFKAPELKKATNIEPKQTSTASTFEAPALKKANNNIHAGYTVTEPAKIEKPALKPATKVAPK